MHFERTRTPQPTTKLRNSAARQARRTHVMLDERADKHLAASINLYTQMLKRPVSTSLIVKRALHVLAEQLCAANSETERAAEATALALSAR